VVRSQRLRELAFGVPRAALRAEQRTSRPGFVGELAIVAVLLFAYDRIRDLSSANTLTAFAHGIDVLSIERALHFNLELPFNLWLSNHQALALTTSLYYQFAHLSMTMTVLATCFIWHPAIYRPARNALLVINAVGMLVFWLFPTAPPRLLPGTGFIDTSLVEGISTPVREGSVNQFAAMPSLHIAWAVWTAVIAMIMVRRRVLQCACMVYPALTTLAVVGTGNHYLLDVVCGLALGLAALQLFRPDQLAMVEVPLELISEEAAEALPAG
jgi:membrane-associated phospholipid phosphatase